MPWNMVQLEDHEVDLFIMICKDTLGYIDFAVNRGDLQSNSMALFFHFKKEMKNYTQWI